MQKTQGFKILQRIETLLMDLQSILRLYPKTEKYTLAERTEVFFLDATKFVYIATYDSTDRLARLKNARVHLQMVGMLLRVAKRKSFVSEGAYENLSLALIEIGKMLSGWIKSVEKSKSQSSAENLR